MFDTDEAPVGARQWPQPGEVWSLWEMQKVDGGAFLGASTSLRSLSTIVDSWQKDQQQRAVIQTDADYFIQEFTSAKPHIEKMGAQITGIAIDDLIRFLSEKNDDDRIYYSGVATHLNTILATLKRELSVTCLFVLEREKGKLFESTAPLFGVEVEKAFPAAAFEIEEAGKCLALSRSTASVFHLMRVIEVALRAVAKCLSIPDPLKEAERNWGVVLKKIKDEMDARAKAGNATQWASQKDKQFFGEVYGSLDAVRVAWRNSTMHVENKYTEDEAEHIWVATKGLMRKLAGRCDELGQPLA